jgi:polysaccharide biosynthesis transport protein
MAGEMTARNGWRVKEGSGREVGHPHPLPTMADSGEIDLRGFFRTIYRGKWILLLTMAASMGATVYWLLNATPLYSADVLIVLDARPSNIVRVEEVMQDVASDDAAKVNTEVAVLQSRGLAAKVIQDLGLENDPAFIRDLELTELFQELERDGEAESGLEALSGADPARGDAVAPAANGGPLARYVPDALLTAVVAAWENGWSFLSTAWAGREAVDTWSEAEAAGEEQSGVPFGVAEERKAALLEAFLARLSVEAEDKSRLIHIGFTSADPSRAAMIANTLVEAYTENQLETKSEGARRAAEWLEVRLAELGETVKTLEDRVQQQRVETGSNGIDIVSQRLGQLNTQLVDAQAASAAATARYEQMRTVLTSHGNLGGIPAIIASPSILALREKHTEAVQRLSEFSATYGANHPQILATRSEIAGIERRLQSEVDNILAGLRNELEAAQIQETAMRSDLEAVSEEMVELKGSEAEIAQVAQRLQANQDLYQNLLKRYTEAVALRENQQPDARVISPAQIPLRPSHPNFPRVIALSFVGSAGLAVVLLVFSERLRQKLDTVEDVERQLGLQVIGSVPDLPRLRRLGSGPRDYIEREPLSEFGGAFQRLRALLTLSNHRVMPRTVLVTSCTAGEGKTTISVCLGIASISSGQAVLLVDCDFARPQVHRMLDVKNDKGLTDILKGTATLEEAITQAKGSKLSILTIGRSPDGAVDLLNSTRMEELLATLQATFDIIILDSAPVQVSNALILGGLAEKTIFVTRREWTTHREASYAVRQLKLYGADIAGVVFNRAGGVPSYVA